MRRFPPNPDAIARPTAGLAPFPPVLTSWDGGAMTPIHNHFAYINADGTGVTNTAASHYHEVRQGRVMSAVGHTHSLTRLPGGRGR